MGTAPNALATIGKYSLSAQFADKYGIDQAKVFNLLKDTCLKSKDPVSDAEVAAFMVVCNKYELDPFLKEIFGFISKGKMQYVVSVDGWSTLLNRQPNMNGVEFEEHFKGDAVSAITCKIHRKDRSLPTVITEYFSECKGSTDTWSKWPIRMLRHKALIQCARLAFGLAGVMDEDEAQRMPGYNAPYFVDAPDEPKEEPSEADAIMTRLGWAPGRKNQAIRAYEEKPEKMLDYLRGEEAKTKPKGKAKPAAEPKTVEADADPVVSIVPDVEENLDAEPPTADEQGRYDFSK